MKIITVIAILIFILELRFRPRFDFTRYGRLLLWYNSYYDGFVERKMYILF